MQVSGAGCLLANAASSAAAKRASFQSGMVRNMNSRAHVVLVPSAGRSGCEQRGRPEPPPRLSKAYLLLADLPNHTRPGNLDERSIRGINELAGGIGLPEVTHGPVVDEVRAIVGPNLRSTGRLMPRSPSTNACSNVVLRANRVCWSWSGSPGWLKFTSSISCP